MFFGIDNVSKGPTSLGRGITGLRSRAPRSAPRVEVLLLELPSRTILVNKKMSVRIPFPKQCELNKYIREVSDKSILTHNLSLRNLISKKKKSE